MLLGAPPDQIGLRAARGYLVTLEPGGFLATKGSVVLGLYVILSGHLTIHVDRGAGPQKVMEWHGGDVSGILPYSRMGGSPGDVRAEEPTEIFVMPRAEIPALIRECYELTAIFVHVMVDRTRLFTSSDLHMEKMSSLGKLAAGLARELNNPASAVARSAKGLRLGLTDVEATSRALGAAGLSDAQHAAVERARGLCQVASGAAFGRSPIEQADREDALADWLARHGADVTAAEPLADSAVTLASLDALAGTLDGAALRAALPWLVAGCATYRLVSDGIEMSRLPASANDLVALLKSRHRVLLEGRPEKHPGVLKVASNRVGAVEFVAPTLVEGTLHEGFGFYRRLASPLARAVFQMFLVSEVHPFDDGNGRIARVMMNAELVAADEQRIIIPQISRNNYLMALRALTVNRRPDALIRTLDFAQRYTASLDYSTFEHAREMLEGTNAFRDPSEADGSGVRLTLPD